MATSKKVSFIIPHKGREEFLVQTIQSIFALTFSHEEIEILVISQNKKLHELNNYENQSLALAISYVSEELTISALRNHGAKLASGEYFAFLDADVSLSTNWLTSLLSLLDEKSERKLVSAMQINGDNAPELEQIRTVLSNADVDCDVNFLPGRNLLLHRETFDKVKGFPEHLITCEDYYFTDKVHELGELYYSSAATYVHIGEDKEYGQMYQKEIWRGQSNLQSIKGRHIPLREWPSFIIPIGLLGLFIIALACFTIGQFALATLALVMAAIPVSAYSLRLYKLAKRTIALKYILKFYAVYFPARAVGTVVGIFKSISIKEKKS